MPGYAACAIFDLVAAAGPRGCYKDVLRLPANGWQKDEFAYFLGDVIVFLFVAE